MEPVTLERDLQVAADLIPCIEELAPNWRWALTCWNCECRHTGQQKPEVLVLTMYRAGWRVTADNDDQPVAVCPGCSLLYTLPVVVR